MLTYLSLNNFKSISTADPIELTKFSAFCGANSSGKSSLIQAILMLSQTFSTRYDFDEIVLNGHLVRLGALGDILSHNAPHSKVSLKFQITTSRLRRDHISEIIYSCDVAPKPGSITPLDNDYHPIIARAEIEIKHQSKGVTTVEYMRIARTEGAIPNPISDITNNDSKYYVEELRTQELSRIAKEYPDYSIIGLEANSTIPYVLHIEYNHSKKTAPELVSLASGANTLHVIQGNESRPELNTVIPHEFFIELRTCIEREREEFRAEMQSKERGLADLLKKLASQSKVSVNDILAQFMSFRLDPNVLSFALENSAPITIQQWLVHLDQLDPATKKSITALMEKSRPKLLDAWDRGMRPDLRNAIVPLQGFSYLSSFLSSFFTRSVKYLGPLRAEPQAVYASFGNSDPRNVGLKGEFTAAVLHINKSREVWYPSITESKENKLTFTKKKAPLYVACKEWLHYLGVINDYLTRDKGKLGYELVVKIDPNDRWQDLTHVGVGVSQVLPIVLMHLLSDAGDVLIFEQPELHLHPKVQSRLCDFFYAMAELDRQSIIETHSEYIVNRLRLRIAQSRNSELMDNSSIFFITKNNAISNFREVNVNEFGAIVEWPVEFFDQSDREVESILIEATKKRRIRRAEEAQ